ncbi:chemotaxis protein CheD [Polyangium jinanense]|uniref:Chemotaxis protein CheD n=1 Tax=Polyangium jinanense TaxID=2829994 RepID=A0A9X4AWV1_9BACT|nr:chemotaxis protein CheD [Polyangium jinanense]MDC3962709.1 chemotaxis protein CheD [Polyangium jinanense]MDC3987758.1 chemotaxis protein CheD [Polyangium jinanense]
MTTVVGSGVAICLFHADRRTAGLCHYTLPLCPQRTASSARFGDSAFRTLMAQLEELGCTAEGMVARVFGGSNISLHASPVRSLGDENVAVALKLLEATGIPIVEQGVGGNKGRHLAYCTDDGTISVRTL